MNRRCLAIIFLLLLTGAAAAQTLEKRPGPAPIPAGAPAKANSDPTYQQLRNVGFSGETSVTNNLVLKRDAATFTFRSGSLYFLAPVNGKVTGAVFVGDGSFTLAPALEMEKKSLAILTKGQPFVEDFSQAVLRFGDGTYEEIKKAAGVSTSSGDGGGAAQLSDLNSALKNKLHWNLHGRILQDVLSPQPGGLFVAFIKGKKYSDKLLLVIDPHGSPFTEPEEISLSTWDDNNYGIWAAFHYAHEYASGLATGKQRNRLVDLEHHRVDATLEKSARLSGDATTTFTAQYEGVRVVPLDLFPSLRVTSVAGADGQSLTFIQEDKDNDPDFYVILAKPLAKGERYTIRTVYEGKDAVSNEGGGNYFPVARTSWYPNAGFKDYATYDLTFRIPKGMKMAATGLPVREVNEGNQTISEWRSEIPLAVAGFNFGQMKRKEAKLAKEDFVVEAYANDAQPDWMSGLSGGTVYQVVEDPRDPFTGEQRARAEATGAVGTMNTTSLMDKALAEGQLSVQLFTEYFGPVPYKRVAMTQQTACNFGQAWPGLVYLPICSFLDTTVRQAILGQFIKNPRSRHRLTIYFKEVAPHEVAHQWWGHAVGWSGYRDQWMSEGFATQSASLFLQLVRKNEKEYLAYWNDLRQQLIDRNPEGYRPIDAGPVTMGYRVNTTKTGFNNYGDLVYPKGGYILHMLRMLMYSRQTGDEPFKTMMKDYVKTYTNQPATTEDFKAMVEKHMTPEMDMAGNRKMDWFFNEYVYGTALPDYKFEHSFSQGADGSPVLNMKITQSNVGPDFMMRVPVYLEFSNGKVMRLGAMPMTGNTTTQQQVPLTGLKDKPKRAILAYFNDVLCTLDGK